jgi:uncharacterized protein (DUF2252 family)
MPTEDSDITNASSINQSAPVEQRPKATTKVTPRLTVQERVELGKAARTRELRSNHAAWDPPSPRPDPVDLLAAQAVTRIPELVPIRYGRMLASPFAFYRGAAAIMACDLATTPISGLQVQLCGDAHLSNFGAFASPERDIVFDINDFDETLPGPWEWDVKRLATSCEIAGRERGFDARQRRSIVLSTVGEYRRAMREFASMRHLEVWYALLDAAKIQARWGVTAKPKDLKKIEADFTPHAHTRDNLRAFEKLTHRVGDQLKIVSHPPLIVPVEELLPEATDRVLYEKTFQNFLRAYGKTLPDDRRRLLEQFRLVHTARKVVGVGSVGTRAWIVLLLGRDDQDPLFLQFKEAQASVLEPYAGKSRFTDHGKRVVEGQRMMQAASDIFLGWYKMPVGMDGKPHDFYARQLWDWKLAADIETMPPKELAIYGEMCSWTLARAHARSGDRIAIGAYLGKGETFDQALAEFAVAYADQNQRDYQALVDAVKSGRLQAETGV